MTDFAGMEVYIDPEKKKKKKKSSVVTTSRPTPSSITPKTEAISPNLN